MNEELDSQLSAMFDDELPEAECQLLARRLSRDEALMARWRRYAVMGAAVRSERGVRLETNLAARVSAVISAEPALEGKGVVSDRPRGGGRFRWWQPVAGGAIAAGVAALSVLWIRAQSPVGTEGELAANSVVAPIASPASGTGSTLGDTNGSYVVPANVEPHRSYVSQAELANYVVAHSEFSAPMSRRNLLSALVSSESGTAGINDESQRADDTASEPGDEAKKQAGVREDRKKNANEPK